MRGLMLAMGIIVIAASAVASKPALRDVPEIDDGLFTVGLAHTIRKECPAIEARLFRAIGYLKDLERAARGLGYTEDEIRRHLESDAEKARLKARAAEYMQAQGYGQDEKGYCALGATEIARKSEIGALLRAAK